MNVNVSDLCMHGKDNIYTHYIRFNKSFLLSTQNIIKAQTEY